MYSEDEINDLISNDKIIIPIYWFGKRKNELCQILYNWFEKNNLIKVDQSSTMTTLTLFIYYTDIQYNKLNFIII